MGGDARGRTGSDVEVERSDPGDEARIELLQVRQPDLQAAEPCLGLGIAGVGGNAARQISIELMGACLDVVEGLNGLVQ